MNNKGRKMIYLLAGGYLVYLAWQMLQSRSEASGTALIIGTVAMIAFAVIGVALVVSSVRTMMKPEPEEESMPDEAEKVEEVQAGEQRHEESAPAEEPGNEESPSAELQEEDPEKEKTEIKEQEP